MRIGFDHYTIAERGLTPVASLDFAGEHGFGGVQFLEPAALDSQLDPERLSTIAAKARNLDLYLEIGIPCPNPIRRSRDEGRDVSNAEHARDLVRHLRAVKTLGCTHARAYVGDRHDRFRTDPDWKTQLAATRDVLSRISPALRDLGLKIAIETHADLTVEELLTLLNALPEEHFGVTLDTGNLAMRLDNPVKAVERLAPRVLCTHLKDAVLARTERGVCWQARPVGSGILPMADMLEPLIRANPRLNLSIELHPRTYDLPISDPTWLAHFPKADLTSLNALVETSERGFADGSLPRPEVVEAIPWNERDLEGLARSLGYLRKLVPALRELSTRLGSSIQSRGVE